jgi:lipoyl(octanoyl) transferase
MSRLRVRHWDAPQDYAACFAAMQAYTQHRDADSDDQLWLLQHAPVLTQGQAGKAGHILHLPPHLPVVQTDRGGQVTWHGPGQLVAYLLYDLNRLGWNVRDLVSHAEQAMIATLADWGVQAQARRDAPGVYVGEAKIGSLGFKIRQGRSYHGLALNVDCDLADFACINPCGFAGLAMTRLVDHAPGADLQTVRAHLQRHLQASSHQPAVEKLE